jgi:hypothetical protein
LNSNQLCDPCPNSCSSCSLSDTDNTLLICDTCLTGYRRNTDYCAACPSYCTKCTDSKGSMICSECQDRYVLNSADNKCLPCPGSCSKCSVSGDTTKCTSCFTGYGITPEGQCQLCADLTLIENCGTCTDADSSGFSECLTCPRGYTFKDDMTKCLQCSDISGCLECKDVPRADMDMERCRDCKEGYVKTLDHQCARMCYACSADPEDWVGQELCKNLNETTAPSFECVRGVCWTERQMAVDGTITLRRGCANYTGNVCDDDYKQEYCNTANGVTVCKKCCAESNCNTHVLTGMSQDAMAIKFSSILLALAALVALLFHS